MKNIDRLLIFLILILIIVLISSSVILTKKGSKCVLNPLIYGAEEMKKANDDKEFECSCSFNAPNSVTILFNSTDKWVFENNYLNITIGNITNGVGEN